MNDLWTFWVPLLGPLAVSLLFGAAVIWWGARVERNARRRRLLP